MNPASPLLTRPAPVAQHRALALALARHSTDPAALRTLLTVHHPDTAGPLTQILDARATLPLDVLTTLVAHRPELQISTGRLRALLFPTTDGCHRFARTIAALEHRPDAIDAAFITTDRFHRHAANANPETLVQALTGTLACDQLTPDRLPTVEALLNARDRQQPDPFIDLAAPLVTRTKHAILVAPLTEQRAAILDDYAAQHGGLTRAIEAFLARVEATVHTSADVAAATEMVNSLRDGPPTNACRAQAPHSACETDDEAVVQAWEAVWAANASTYDGAAYEPHQRVLVTAYHLLAEHARAHPDTPTAYWATDPAGRQLLHAVADRLTGYHGIRPLDRFTDDTHLLAFARGLAKLHRHRMPGDLHITGFMAAVKAARSKSHLIDATKPINVGIVIPLRDETPRLAPSSPDNPHGQNAARVKLAQLAWLINTTPEARVGILFVDESPTGDSALSLRRILADHPATPGLITTIAAYPYQAGATSDDNATQPASSPDDTAKGGAVLWGLARLLDAGYPTLAYTDADLTYPLDQLGLLLHALAAAPGTGATIGSRRTPDAHGYYPPTGPTRTNQLYQQAVAELLDLDHVNDPQAGFKAFPAGLLRDILPATRDRHLSFDTELLALTHLAGQTINETGICALHQWTDGAVGTPRDYDAMLSHVRQQAHRHRFTPGRRPTPTLTLIADAGGLAHATRRQAATPVTIRPAGPAKRPSTSSQDAIESPA
ncbi:hypothetical protein E0H26_25325 [Micromonospora zingiberis]|uniref:Glycosyltransferase family 2 protein n=1 Tax=Micromonospora zingiberis TaxID=2053011 RepID=A0A4R0G9I2_9ACTN|nr:hypothetical protein [Micromonospora zingiberis]TCB91611.1 hypothetical protein E0H26_25325 [Micromonospora zingiberis]